MRRYIEGHQSLEKGLGGFVVTEQSVSVHIIPGKCWLRTIRAGNSSQDLTPKTSTISDE